MMQDNANIENNFNYNYLLVQTILKMRDAQAEERIPQYWIYFETGLKLVVSHLDFQLKGEIQQDYAILMAAFKRIRALPDSQLNPQSKISLINKLKEDFANAHNFYIMQALNRVGVVKVEDEGIIDFESVDLDTMTKIVRDTHTSSVVGSAKEVEEKKTPPLVKPEMVLVYRDKKVLSMPKADYEQLQADKADPILIGEMPEEEIEADGDIERGEEIEPESEDAEAMEGTPKDDTEVETAGNQSANTAPSKKFGWKRKFE